MRTCLFGLLLVLIGTACAAGEEGDGVDAREAKMAAAALVRQNQALRDELSRLRAEVARLTGLLARSRAELDEVRFSQGGDAGGKTPEGAVPEEGGAADVRAGSWTISEFNPDLKLAVLDGGKASGLKPGMMLYVLRDEKPAARIRVVDVRERISGAVIQEIMGTARPEKGDRVVLMTGP